ncbi:MAG: hypothetical protein ACD_15C00112G0005 [uncultured bacterium]|nr:MAG: hypothetical protein ACD_15C00112G0005 [uncultured bacterium]HCU70662.1 hypothetical protein [Candidatus Moranbacteria bacterium]
MWNPFAKNTKKNDDTSAPKMGMLQALAMKKMAKMSPKEKEKMMQEARKPENREQIMKVMNMMKKTGQVTDEQIEQAKKMFGL